MSRSSRLLLALCLSLSAAFGLSTASAQPTQAEPDRGRPDMHALAQPVATAAPENLEDEARRKQVLAKVNGVEITIGKVEDFIATQPPMMRSRYQNRAEQEQLIENLVRIELLAAEAQKKGYDKTPAVVRTVKDASVQALLRSEIEDKFSPDNVSSADVQKYYEEHRSEFHRPASRRVSLIVLASEDEAKSAIAELQKADARAFAEYARNKSIDAGSKARGGDLGYFSKDAPEGQADKIGEAVRKAAFGLKNNGDTSATPVAVEQGFAVLRLTGERPERNTGLADADSAIRTKLWRQQRQQGLEALVSSLREKDKPQVFAERANWVKIDDMDKRPGGFAPEQRPQPKNSGGKAAPEAEGTAP